MKKILVIILSVFMAATLFAADFTFPETAVTDLRSMAMGGTHLADYTDYFTLYRNPSLLSKSGKHWYWDNMTVNFGGPLDKFADLYQQASEGTLDLEGNPTEMLQSDAISGLLENGINLDVKMNLPFLSFGGIGKRGFGWGIYDRMVIDANIPSLMGKMTASAMVEGGFIMGLGKTIQLNDVHAVSVGGSLRTYTQAPQAGVKVKLMDMLNGSDMMDNVMKSVAVGAKAGFNLDLAATYSFSNLVDAALVLHNAVAPAWSSNADFAAVTEGDFSSLTELKMNEKMDPAKLGIGVGVKVPTWWSLGIISNFNVYADQYDVLNIFKTGLHRNPWLDFGVGTELSILRILDLRAGLYDGYLNAGVGINLGALNMDFAMYGKELSTQPGGNNQLNVAFSWSLQR